MVSWPWLIVAFACGGIVSLVGLAAYLTQGFSSYSLQLWNALIDHALEHKGEIVRRARRNMERIQC